MLELGFTYRLDCVAFAALGVAGALAVQPERESSTWC
jgi:hypothetical protein